MSCGSSRGPRGSASPGAQSRCVVWAIVAAIVASIACLSGCTGEIEDQQSASGYGSAAVLPFDETLVAFGSLSRGEGIAYERLASWDGAKWSSFGDDYPYQILDMATYGSQVVAVGTEHDGVLFVDTWDGSSWARIADAVHLRGAWTLTGLVEFDGRLVLSGYFNEIDGVSVDNVAAWENGSWGPVGNLEQRVVSDIVEYGGDLYACGWSQDGGFVGRWTGDDWVILATTAPAVSSISHLISVGEELFAFGVFESIDGELAHNIAMFDGDGWMSWEAPPDGYATAMTAWNGRLVAGARSVVVWDNGAWRRLGTGSFSTVRSLVVYRGDLIVAGRLDYVRGLTARWDGEEWRTMGLGIVRVPFPANGMVLRP